MAVQERAFTCAANRGQRQAEGQVVQLRGGLRLQSQHPGIRLQLTGVMLDSQLCLTLTHAAAVRVRMAVHSPCPHDNSPKT